MWRDRLKRSNDPARPIPAMVVLDTVIDEMDRELAIPAPERGGALMGPEGRELITHLLADPTARTTSASYEASNELMERVIRTEDDSILRWKGIAHSHPGAMAELSGPDLARLRDGLESNPWLPWLHAPIVTEQPPGHGCTAVEMKHGWLCWHTARLLRDRQLVIENRRVVILPLGEDLRMLAERHNGRLTPIVTDPGTGVTGVGGRVDLPGGGELVVLASDHYPLAAPLVLFTAPGADTAELAFSWSMGAGENRLVDAVTLALGDHCKQQQRRLFVGPEGRPEHARVRGLSVGVSDGGPTTAFGPRPDLALTTDAQRADDAGWAPAEGDPRALCEELRRGLAARGRGLTSETLGDRTVLIVGCGSVGSYAAEQLARSGVGTLVLVDPDRVDATNLSRTSFAVADLGVFKTDAIRRRLLNLHPSMAIDTDATAVGDMSEVELDSLVRRSDVVVAATDDPAAQLELARHAQRHERPALFVGLTAGARGGEVIVTVPGQTPCYRCATPVRHVRDAHAGLARDTDYGTGRMHGVVALSVDIQHVAGVAVKLCISLLLQSDEHAELGRFAPAIVAAGMTFLTFSMSSDYWFYPGYFGSLGGQFGYQSVGLSVDGDPDCPICGTVPELDLAPDTVAPAVEDIRASWPEHELSLQANEESVLGQSVVTTESSQTNARDTNQAEDSP